MELTVCQIFLMKLIFVQATTVKPIDFRTFHEAEIQVGIPLTLNNLLHGISSTLLHALYVAV